MYWFLLWGCQTTTISYTELAREIYMSLSYESLSQPEEMIGVQPSTSPHGPGIQIWWNETAAVSDRVFPVGSMIVKEGYFDEEGTEMRSLLLMRKDVGYNGGIDWFWASFDPHGEVEQAGSPDFCISCHASSPDFVLSLE